MKKSKRFQLNAADFKKWGLNILIFSAPALILLLGDVVNAIPTWFNGPWQIVAMFVVNQLIDLLRKFIAGK